MMQDQDGYRQPPGAKEEGNVTRRFVLSTAERFWTMFEFFLWVIWIWILIMMFIDIFCSHDLAGRAEALGSCWCCSFPLIGVLVYRIARGGKIHERAARQARAYIQQAAASSPASMTDLLTKLTDLRTPLVHVCRRVPASVVIPSVLPSGMTAVRPGAILRTVMIR
jgi:hypothetical protein